MQVMAALGKLIGYTIAGAVLMPLAALALSIPIYVLDPRCGTPGDSGGCEMGIATNALMAVPFGAAIGLAFGLWRVLRARRKMAS